MSDRDEIVETIKGVSVKQLLYEVTDYSAEHIADAILEWYEKEVKRRIISLGNRVPTKTVIEGGNL